MSADGEINVAVRAEGADDAADELAQRGGGDGGGGGGGLTGALRGAGVLAILASVLDLLGPVGDFLDAIFNILKAFLAPIGLIIFRLLSPVLRLLVSLLPAWFDLTREIDKRMQTFVGTLGDARDRIQDIVSNTDSLSDLPSALVSFEQVLASLLPRELKQLRAIIKLGFEILKKTFERLVPNLNVPGFGGGGGTQDAGNSGLRQAAEAGLRAGVNVTLRGGLAAFVDEIERRQDVDF
jgi:hypothetical protein